MSNISDSIEQFIKNLMKDEYVEIQRNELAVLFNCVPSQINYVISTRFTEKQGYVVESKRGGGGFIKIKRLHIDTSNYLMHIVLTMDDSISEQEAKLFISNFYDYGAITIKEAKIMTSAISDKAINIVNPLKSVVRASILKSMILSII